jgi:aryl-alcohol dehydrogenase-like predicted oxidoreductase
VGLWVARMGGVKTAELGRTGLPVTPLGLGLAALGRPAYINLGRDRDLGSLRSVDELELRSRTMLDTASRAGIRYFDVARSYGHAERFLASWLRSRAVAPAQVTVGSKWGYVYVGDWRRDASVHEVKDHSLAALRRQYVESRELLADHLDLYQIHSATLETGVLEDASVVSELAEISETGVAIGLSLSGPRQGDALRVALEVEVDGVNPFSCIQATFNLLEPSAGDALRDAHDAGWGVIIKEALANGRLSSHDEDPSFADRRVVLEEMAQRYEATVDAVAISWVLSQSFVDTVLSGAVAVDQLESNLAALRVKLSPEDLSAVECFAEPPERYWEARKKLPWA